MNRRPEMAQGLRLLAAGAAAPLLARACLIWTGLICVALLTPAAAADAIFPTGSRLGLVPPPGLKQAGSFPGFEDQENGVFIRIIALPAEAFAEIEKTFTADALKKQRMTIEKRETLTLNNRSGILAIVRQETATERIRKWLLIAPVDNMTALVSVETSAKPSALYPDSVVRTALASLTSRPVVPPAEQLSLVPFRVGDTAGMRLVRVVPGVAVQFTDGPKDAVEATEQPHLIIAAAPGGPADPRDRDQFARDAMAGFPQLKEMRIVSSEPMRVGGQYGYEVRAQGKDVQSGAEIEIVQWLRFGTGAYLRIVGFTPKDRWADMFTRFRAVRDGLEPR